METSSGTARRRGGQRKQGDADVRPGAPERVTQPEPSTERPRGKEVMPELTGTQRTFLDDTTTEQQSGRAVSRVVGRRPRKAAP